MVEINYRPPPSSRAVVEPFSQTMEYFYSVGADLGRGGAPERPPLTEISHYGLPKLPGPG